MIFIPEASWGTQNGGQRGFILADAARGRSFDPELVESREGIVSEHGSISGGRSTTRSTAALSLRPPYMSSEHYRENLFPTTRFWIAGILVETDRLDRADAEYGPEYRKANAGNAERMPVINSAMPFVNLLPDREVH